MNEELYFLDSQGFAGDESLKSWRKDKEVYDSRQRTDKGQIYIDILEMECCFSIFDWNGFIKCFFEEIFALDRSVNELY